MNKSEIAIYQTADGLTKIDARLDGETVWLTLDQMAALFERDKSTVSRHIKNVFDEEELDRNSVVANFATTAAQTMCAEFQDSNLQPSVAEIDGALL